MRTCKKCHVEKPLSEFHLNSRGKDGRAGSCKACVREYGRQRHHAMTPEQVERRNAMARNRYHGESNDKYKQTWQRRYDSFRSKVRNIKTSHTCLRCGESDHYALDFHHVAEKGATIGSGQLGRSILEKEISKCVVLCANCHRKLHAERWSLMDFAPKIESEYPEAYALLLSIVPASH